MPENADAAAHDIGETAGVRHILSAREGGVRPVPVRTVQSGDIEQIPPPPHSPHFCLPPYNHSPPSLSKHAPSITKITQYSDYTVTGQE